MVTDLEVLKIGVKSRLGDRTLAKLKLRSWVVVHIVHTPNHDNNHYGDDWYDNYDNDHDIKHVELICMSCALLTFPQWIQTHQGWCWLSQLCHRCTSSSTNPLASPSPAHDGDDQNTDDDDEEGEDDADEGHDDFDSWWPTWLGRVRISWKCDE